MKKNKSTILEIAKQTIIAESNAIANLVNFIDEDFENAVNYIHHSKGRIVITGVGKSAIIATKIVATLNSTGSPAIYMHAADAIHGDLGTIQKNDVVVCISKSGNTPEIKVLIPFIKNFGNKIIAITGNPSSFLGENADFCLNCYVEKEVCPNNLAPTSSTTAQMVIGDALAVCLLELNNFSSQDFAKYHPGGALGKKLLFKVSSMLEHTLKPLVTPDTPIKKVIFEISEKRLGVTAVVEDNKVVGIITDGDIRRMLNDRDTFAELTAKDIMTKNPKLIKSTDMVVAAFNLMEDNAITQLIVVDDDGYKGVLHLHDILKEGIV